MMSITDNKNAYFDGRDAAWKLLPKSANPEPEGTWAHHEWSSGWDHGLARLELRPSHTPRRTVSVEMQDKDGHIKLEITTPGKDQSEVWLTPAEALLLAGQLITQAKPDSGPIELPLEFNKTITMTSVPPEGDHEQ